MSADDDGGVDLRSRSGKKTHNSPSVSGEAL